MTIHINTWKLHSVAVLAKKAATLDRKAQEASRKALKAREALEDFIRHQPPAVA